ncbi:MAG: hypothetical protein M0Q95_14360 [Porticoccaceae bacterium]|nr:hypothetical protein [Porticoccaceae bacterium]
MTSLAAAVESRFQRTLGYPANATGTDNVKGAFSQWSPSKADFFDFNYVAPVNGSTYILQADGKGAMAGCILKLHGDNTARTATAACKMGTTW